MLKRVLILLLFVCAAMAEETEKEKGPTAREKNKQVVEKRHQEAIKKYEKNPDYLVLPGLVADRKNKRIEILGESSGLTTRETVEFFLIHESSGHDYEALAISFAKPGDVHKALEFIGMSSGRPVNFKQLSFWPRGERVIMTINGVRIEDMIRDSKNKATMNRSGFVFTGAVMIEHMGKPGTKVYSANVREPNAIASNYNERESVLDIPRAAPQGTVYGAHQIDPEHAIPEFQMIDIALEPEYKDGRKRVLNVVLGVKKGKQREDESPLASVDFSLTDEDGKVHNSKPGLNDLLETFVAISDSGRDSFVTFRPDDNVSIGTLNALSKILASIETEKGIRMEAPMPETLYYRAFIPNESIRKRDKRIGQPWELRLSASEKGVTGILTKIHEKWADGAIWPDLTAVDHPVASPEELRGKLKDLGPGKNAIICYVAADLTLGQLMRYIKPQLPTHPNIHVFVETEKIADPEE